MGYNSFFGALIQTGQYLTVIDGLLDQMSFIGLALGQNFPSAYFPQ